MQAWALVMVLFGSTPDPSGITHTEILKVYATQASCSSAIVKALTIKMPVARSFFCLKFKQLPAQETKYVKKLNNNSR